MALDPVLGLAVRLVAAALLAAAAVAKFRSLEAFAGVVRNYRLLPEPLAGPAALLIPPVELALALLLVLPTAAPAGGAAAALLVTYAAAMTINLRRGRADIDCGCFVGILRQRLSWPLVMRNLVLAAALLAAALLPAGERVLHPLDLVSVAGGVAGLLLVWAGIGRLYGRASRSLAGEAG
jgi:hypothetical protein